MQLGQYPEPTLTIAHLSDTHLLADDKLQFGAVQPETGLLQALDRVSRLRPRPDAIVVTGDLADLGEPSAYARLRELVEPAAAALGATLVWVIGNHDDRAAYAQGLFDRTRSSVERVETKPQDAVYDVQGLRIISLDSTVPGYHHGEIEESQLAWLAEVLATPAERGTVLALHHPPVPLPMAPVDAVIELDDQEALARVLEGSDVRAILAGHLHYSTYSTFAGIPVSVASASCYTLDPAPRGSLLHSVDAAQSINVSHVYEDRIVHTVVPLAEGRTVHSVPPEREQELLALTAEERRELLSRKDSPYYASTPVE